MASSSTSPDHSAMDTIPETVFLPALRHLYQRLRRNLLSTFSAQVGYVNRTELSESGYELLQETLALSDRFTSSRYGFSFTEIPNLDLMDTNMSEDETTVTEVTESDLKWLKMIREVMSAAVTGTVNRMGETTLTNTVIAVFGGLLMEKLQRSGDKERESIVANRDLLTKILYGSAVHMLSSTPEFGVMTEPIVHSDQSVIFPVIQTPSADSAVESSSESATITPSIDATSRKRRHQDNGAPPEGPKKVKVQTATVLPTSDGKFIVRMSKIERALFAKIVELKNASSERYDPSAELKFITQQTMMF